MTPPAADSPRHPAHSTAHAAAASGAKRTLLAKLPPGSAQLDIENLEGIILVPARLRGAADRDTSGVLVVDTGAGFLALDEALALTLGVSDSSSHGDGLQTAPRALTRLELGTIQRDQLAPVLLIDADIIRRVTGRDVLGLAGQRVFAGHAVWIDYAGGRLVCVPSPPDSLGRDPEGDPAGAAARAGRSRRLLAALLSASARPIPFRLAGDHKMLVRVRIRDAGAASPGEWLTLVFDTGATKSCLFEPELTERLPGSKQWRSITGLVAPTLAGNSVARLALAPVVELESVDADRPLREERVDCAVITSKLSADLSAAVGEPVLGLLGYSFFKRYRVAVDYPNRTLWLDPDPHARDDHPYEYSHIGIQLERDGERVRVVGIAAGSPADGAGISVGDTLIAIGLRPARPDALLELTDLLEGAPGTRLQVTLLRSGVPRIYRLVRRRLL